MTRISVIMPVYNGAKYLARAIDSVLAQTLADFELLIIDDGSTDNSSGIVRSCRDSRIHFVRNTHNLGISPARNLGLKMAQGEYIVFLDSDDYAHPERLRRQIDYLDKNPCCAVVGCWERSMDESGIIFGGIKRRPLTPQDARSQSLFKCTISTRAMAGRRSTILEYGFLDKYAVSHDFDLCVRLSEEHEICNIPDVLILHRLHSGNISRTMKERHDAEVREIIGYQLRKLGIVFSNSDLRRHLQLKRIFKQPPIADRDFLEWAEDWLIQLRKANNIRKLYPEQAFGRTLGLYWLSACWHIEGKQPWPLLRHLCNSRLRACAWNGMWETLLLYLRKPGVDIQRHEFRPRLSPV